MIERALERAVERSLQATVERSAVEESPAYTGPLDLVPGAVVAFDQFAPSAAWLAGTNNFCILRRSSDEAELQFQYSADGSPPQDAMIAWRDAEGAATGFYKTWTDGSGNSKDATQAIGINQPVFQDSAFGDIPSPSFYPGNDESLLATPSVTFPDGAYTVIAVVTPASSGGISGIAFRSSAVTFMQIAVLDNYDPDAKIVFQFSTNSGLAEVGASTDVGELPVFRNTPQIISIKCANGSRTIKANGVAKASTTFDVGSVGSISGALALGGNDANIAVADLLAGYIPAYYQWNGVKDDADVLAVTQMLATRYGITLP